MNQPASLAAVAAAALLGASLCAQARPMAAPAARPTPPPAPRAQPVVPPPVDHPALAAQPWAQRDARPRPAATAPVGGPTGPGVWQADDAAKVRRLDRARRAAAAMGMPDLDGEALLRTDEFRKLRVPGAVVEERVDRVAALDWQDDLFDARARSAATGRPILWVHALGDLEGFA
ncbi:MAG: hypothetical protein AB7O97_14560 [Planctomycetota bacterium]